MPEGPELRLAAKFVNEVGAKYVFGGRVVKSELATKHQEVDYDAEAYQISAQSRGKEIKVFLKEVAGAGSSNKRKKKVVAAAANDVTVEHLLFRFGMSGSFKFHSVEEVPKHAHLRFTTKDGRFMLSFVDYRRFGRWHINEDWGSDRGPDIIDEPADFRRNVLANLDKADFNRPICEAMLNQKYFNGVGNYLRAEVLYRAGVPPFARARDVLQPLADDNVDQNGSAATNGATANGSSSSAAQRSNTKRKQAKAKPVTAEVKKEETDILNLCNIVMQEVLGLGDNFVGGGGYVEPGMDSSGGYVVQGSEKELGTFYEWLQCYTKDGMKNLVDHNGRTIWFSGEAGPLKPTNSKSRTSKKRKQKSNAAAEDDHDYSSSTSSKARVKKEETDDDVIKKEEKCDVIKQENGNAEFSPVKTRRQRKNT